MRNAFTAVVLAILFLSLPVAAHAESIALVCTMDDANVYQFSFENNGRLVTINNEVCKSCNTTITNTLISITVPFSNSSEISTELKFDRRTGNVKYNRRIGSNRDFTTISGTCQKDNAENKF